jgi:hypothetical protein
MTATTVKSENITNIEATPITALDRKRGRIKSVIDQDAVATTSIDEVGDVTLFGPIPSNAVILDVLVLNDDLDTNATETLDLNWGLYYSGIGGTQAKDGNTSGTVVDADCFAADSAAFEDANTSYVSVRFATDDIVDIKKEAWQVAGLTADPGGLLYVGMTVGTNAAATAAAGDVVVRVDYI